MKKTLQSSIKTLAEKAGSARNPLEAQQLTQAAGNLTHVLCDLKNNNLLTDNPSSEREKI